MNRKLLSAVCALLFGVLQVNAQWTTVGAAGFSAGNMYGPVLAFSAAGKPYIAYNDWVNGNKATVMTFDGTNWIPVGMPGFSTKVQQGEFSLAVHPTSGEPYVAYSDYENLDKVTVMKFNGSAWVLVGSADFSSSYAAYTSIAFHPISGEPYVAYQDAGNSYKVTVMKFDGTAWVPVGSAGFSSSQSIYISLAFHPTSGEPYVVYRDYDNLGKATAMKYNGTAWVPVGSAGGFSTGIVEDVSFAFSAIGEPYVAYRDWTNSNKITVMKFNGTTWVNVGLAGFSAGDIVFTSLACHPTSNEPYVAFSAWNNPNNITVMKFDGTAWVAVPVGSTGLAAGNVWKKYIAFNPVSGEPYVAYQDAAIGSRATVMKYGSPSGIHEVNPNSITTVYPNPVGSILNIEVKESTNIKIENLLGAIVATQHLNAGNNSIDVSTLTKGVYIIRSSNGSGMKFVKE